MFPGQFIWIILNTLECSCSKINGELSCAPCTYDYMLLIISLVYITYFSFIIVSVCVAFIFHLIVTKFTLYPLLDYTLYRIVPRPRILTAGLQAHIKILQLVVQQIRNKFTTNQISGVQPVLHCCEFVVDLFLAFGCCASCCVDLLIEVIEFQPKSY